MKDLRLPEELWVVIYSFDNTYKEIFNKVLQELEYKWYIIHYLLLIGEIQDFFEIFYNEDYDIDWGL